LQELGLDREVIYQAAQAFKLIWGNLAVFVCAGNRHKMAKHRQTIHHNVVCISPAIAAATCPSSND
jgi:hypothetical protein